MDRSDNENGHDARQHNGTNTEYVKHIHGIPPSELPLHPRPNPLSRSRLEKLSSPKYEVSMPNFITPYNFWETSLRKRLIYSTGSLSCTTLPHKRIPAVLPSLKNSNNTSDVDQVAARSAHSTFPFRHAGSPKMSIKTVAAVPPSTKMETNTMECSTQKNDSHVGNKTCATKDQIVKEPLPLFDPNQPNHLTQQNTKHDDASFAVKPHTRTAKLVEVDMIRFSIQNSLGIIFYTIYTHLWKRAALIQRNFRSHRRRLCAGVELNFLKLRRYEEPLYWTEVASRCDQEILRVIRNKLLISQPNNPTSNHRSTTLESSKRTTCKYCMTSSDVDVYNYSKIGLLPESLLRKEVETALLKNLRRDVTSSLSFHPDPFLPLPFEEHNGRMGLSKITFLSNKSKAPKPRFPIFLTHNTFSAIIDNVCFIIGKFRDDPVLLAHLKGRDRSIANY
ncbi:unnamed protein product [Phytomonas sp. Hart1]|nr:unnamed protein product [Phytomonas sp. Hart1]|eukprot:CCW67104.1 unnamed protein product [Phytomonas sp. isolate Hart1]